MNLSNEILQVCFDIHEKRKTPSEGQEEILRLLIVVGALAEQLCPKCGSDNIEPSDKENDNECNYCGLIWA
jgi:predicted RNA-binding Zn-ribbon protein involved in translation (DUF1610 family)